MKKLVEELAPWARFHQEGGDVIIVKGRREHVFGVPRDIDDLR